MNNDKFDVSEPWESTNQDWWDWYVTLAYNDENLKKRFSYRLPKVLTEAAEGALPIKEIHSEYSVSDADVTKFREDGFIKLKNVFSPSTIGILRRQLISEVMKRFKTKEKQKQKFLSLDLIWEKNQVIKEFVVNKRLAGIVGRLLGVNAVRLYHDNVLSKEPGCGRTPWHYDTHHFPIATTNVVTAWIPAQAIPIEMGPLIFAKPINAYKFVEHLRFSKEDTEYDQDVWKIFQNRREIEIDCQPYEIGEVSFHHNLSFHSASPNLTSESRLVLANTYFEDGAKLVDQPTMVSGNWQQFIPDTNPGQIIRTKRNPICWEV